MEKFVIVIAMSLISIGLAVSFFGTLSTSITALGKKHYYWGWGILAFFPLSLIYTALHWKSASYPGKMVYGGIGSLTAGIILIFISVDVLYYLEMI